MITTLLLLEAEITDSQFDLVVVVGGRQNNLLLQKLRDRVTNYNSIERLKSSVDDDDEGDNGFFDYYCCSGDDCNS